MTARRFKLPTAHPWRLVGILAVGTAGFSLVGGHYLSTQSNLRDFWVTAALSGICTGGGPLLFALIAAIREWRSGSPQSVDVGVDGVLVGARFIPYSSISSVEHSRQERMVNRPIQAYDHLEFEETTSYEWTVSIGLGSGPGGDIPPGGETVEITTKRSPTDAGDPLGEEIARAIDAGLAEWAAGQHSEDRVEDILRRERTGSEWLEALRGLGSGASTSYRNTMDFEKLSRLLDDPRAKPSTRAAAAIVLASSGDNTAAAKLRVAAGAMVDRRVRVALENIADEAAIAEALESLEDAEHERGKLGTLS